MPARRVVRILVVDDDAAVAELFGKMLRAEGFDVRTLNVPEDGLRQAHDYHPDVILIDLRMPRVNGLALLRQLRAVDEFAATPAAIVTGAHLVDEDEKELVAALGADLIYKPVWSDDLVALVRRLVGQAEGRPKR